MKVQYLFLSALILMSSCIQKHNGTATTDKSIHDNLLRPDSGYKMSFPEGWKITDTVLQGKNMRFVVPASAVDDADAGITIVTAPLQEKNIDQFTSKSLEYFRSIPANTVSNEIDSINIGNIVGNRFFYTKQENGLVIETVVYLVPLRGYVYYIACSVMQGHMEKYKPIFDKTIRSFKE